jgi:hypothetical protein
VRKYLEDISKKGEHFVEKEAKLIRGTIVIMVKALSLKKTYRKTREIRTSRISRSKG